MYRCETPETREICAAIGWDYDTQPIKTMIRAGRVYVTGTLLKPEEWRTLDRRYPRHLQDGRPVILTGYPM